MIVLLSVIGGGIGLWLAMTLPPVYRTEAVLIVESSQIPDELAASTVQTGEIEALQIIRQRITSREVLLDMANAIGIYEDSSDLGADEKVADLRRRIGIETSGGPSRRTVTDATIVTVSFTAPTARMAAETVNHIVTLILQANVEMRTSVARQTLDFFTQEVDRFEQELSQISGKILNFQESNLEALPDSLEFRRNRQAGLQERLVQLEREQSTLQDRRAQLVTLFETTGNILLDGQNRNQRTFARRLERPAEQRLAELQGEIASLSAVLSENNPRMVLLRSQIEAAEALVATLPPIEDMQDPNGNVTTAASLYDIQLADLDAQIVYIEDQKSAAEAQMSQISRTIEATPGNSVTLTALERTFSNLQEQYNQAVANKARAETGSMIEALSRGQRITLVEQAVAPTEPSSPNRPVVLIGGLGLGLFLALGLVALFELLNRTIRHPNDLQKALGIEAFATIPYIVTRREAFVNTVRRLTIGSLCIGFVVGGLWFVDQNVLPLQPVINRLVGLGP